MNAFASSATLSAGRPSIYCRKDRPTYLKPSDKAESSQRPSLFTINQLNLSLKLLLVDMLLHVPQAIRARRPIRKVLKPIQFSIYALHVEEIVVNVHRWFYLQLTQFQVRRRAAAPDVAVLARGLVRSTVFVIVRIMYMATSLNQTSFKVEHAMTPCTPHLRATLCFCHAHSTFWTLFRIAREKLERRHRIWIARVFDVGSEWFVAMLTELTAA